MTTQNTIIIYGPGCARCEELELRTRQAVNALSGQYTIRHERDAAAMAAAGILSTPALELNGKLLFSGKVPALRELQQLLGDDTGTAHAAQEASDCDCSCSCRTEALACSCGGKCNADAGETRRKKAEAPACSCGGKCNRSSKGGTGKRLLQAAVIAVLAVGAIKYINRINSESAAPAATASAASEEVRAVYYTFGKRCPTCIRMETWAKEAVEANFSQELQNGTLRFETQDADAATAQQHGLTTKSLLLHRSGVHPQTLNLTRIWELSHDEASFKSYVAQELRNFLNSHE